MRRSYRRAADDPRRSAARRRRAPRHAARAGQRRAGADVALDGRPGRERRSLGRRPGRAGAPRVPRGSGGAAPARGAGACALAASSSSARRRRRRAGSSSRSSASTATARWRPTAAPHPASRRGPRPGVVRRRRPAPLGLLPAARADRRRSGGGRASHARPGRAIVAVDVSTWIAVDDPFRSELGELAPDVVFATYEEEQALGRPARRHAGCASAARRPVLRDGARLPAMRRATWSTRPVPGDALAAGFLVGGPHSALEAAARLLRRAWGRCRSARAMLPAAPPEIASAPRPRPVVALETTLIAHGFPPARASWSAEASEAAVRAGGAVPATIGVLDGEIRVGLDAASSRASTPPARKLGPRDLAAASCSARSARRPSAARSPCAAPPASASWRPAASAASIAAGRPRPTSRPTCRRSRGRR